VPIQAELATDAPSSQSQKEKVSELQLVLQSAKMEGREEGREGAGEKERWGGREAGGGGGGRERVGTGEGHMEREVT
jgi:hypothetical protein